MSEIKHTHVDQFRDSKGNLLVEYMPGKPKPFSIPYQTYSLAEVKVFLSALSEAMERCSRDKSV